MCMSVQRLDICYIPPPQQRCQGLVPAHSFVLFPAILVRGNVLEHGSQLAWPSQVVVGAHTLDNSVRRKFLDETPFLVGVEVEMKCIYNRQKV